MAPACVHLPAWQCSVGSEAWSPHVHILNCQMSSGEDSETWNCLFFRLRTFYLERAGMVIRTVWRVSKTWGQRCNRSDQVQRLHQWLNTTWLPIFEFTYFWSGTRKVNFDCRNRSNLNTRSRFFAPSRLRSSLPTVYLPILVDESHTRVRLLLRVQVHVYMCM